MHSFTPAKESHYVSDTTNCPTGGRVASLSGVCMRRKVDSWLLGCVWTCLVLAAGAKIREAQIPCPARALSPPALCTQCSKQGTTSPCPCTDSGKRQFWTPGPGAEVQVWALLCDSCGPAFWPWKVPTCAGSPTHCTVPCTEPASGPCLASARQSCGPLSASG